MENFTMILSLVIAIFVAYWLYNDSKKTNIGKPILWAIFGFLFALPTVIVYLIMKSRSNKNNNN